ncbi:MULTISPECIES: VOC family protein [unclassified Methanoregula]|uniref:VOC family protein n=1 Tax=unclassified Methanoregula TaxID=2649730 RepID=UPI0009C6831E|nr:MULTISPECIES: VOC family protein [unclassified Methanoregula]OPX65313.1 MAG: 3-demethylubiquinone-9 3-methyltransferase [Methanoregula sp. PtaB.Bin085]OPY32222.1 MAG: 3-demethylubiquinone-9 3-methyltransferase [Methanoregula sp. PtaU1.Bin006]
MAAAFRVAGHDIVALNGSPGIPFSQAVSFAVNCRNQKEIDRYWERLSNGGKEQRCGRLKDRFGVSWQIIPSAITRMPGDPDPEMAARVMKAMLPMAKPDIGALTRAYKGK